jgi:hypothetical protein
LIGHHPIVTANSHQAADRKLAQLAARRGIVECFEHRLQRTDRQSSLRVAVHRLDVDAEVPAGSVGAQLKNCTIRPGQQIGSLSRLYPVGQGDMAQYAACRLANRLFQRLPQYRFGPTAQDRKEVGAGMGHKPAIDQRREHRAMRLDRVPDVNRLLFASRNINTRRYVRRMRLASKVHSWPTLPAQQGPMPSPRSPKNRVVAAIRAPTRGLKVAQDQTTAKSGPLKNYVECIQRMCKGRQIRQQVRGCPRLFARIKAEADEIPDEIAGMVARRR